MTKTDNPPRRRLGLPFAIAAVAVIIVGAVVYGTMTPAGKVAGTCPKASKALAERLEPLAKGQVSALSIEANPRPAIPLTFERQDGAKTSLADFKGRSVLLNLWATWCVPCRAEMPSLDRLQAQKGGKDFEVVAVNVDTARLERRAAFLNEIGVKSLARFADPSGDAFETLRKDGQTLGLPVTRLVDPDGCLIGVARGAVAWDSPEALALISAALKPQGGA